MQFELYVLNQGDRTILPSIVKNNLSQGKGIIFYNENSWKLYYMKCEYKSENKQYELENCLGYLNQEEQVQDQEIQEIQEQKDNSPYQEVQEIQEVQDVQQKQEVQEVQQKEVQEVQQKQEVQRVKRCGIVGIQIEIQEIVCKNRAFNPEKDLSKVFTFQKNENDRHKISFLDDYSGFGLCTDPKITKATYFFYDTFDENLDPYQTYDLNIRFSTTDYDTHEIKFIYEQ